MTIPIEDVILSGRTVKFEAMDFDKIGLRWRATVILPDGFAFFGGQSSTISGALMDLIRVMVDYLHTYPERWERHNAPQIEDPMSDPGMSEEAVREQD